MPRIIRLLVLLLAPGAAAAQTTQQTGAGDFDFMLGDWEVSWERIGNGDRQKPTGETMRFERTPNGPGLVGYWRLNRGTETATDFTDALYVHAFDRESQAWSFYYASDRSAQLYQGRRNGSEWAFYRPYNDNGLIMQRQTWRRLGTDTLVRVIEDSAYNGNSWRVVYEQALARRGSSPTELTADRSYYDFWTGDWYGFENGVLDSIPSYSVSRTLNARAIQEKWIQRIDGRLGHSIGLRTWDEAEKRWQFVWIAGDGIYQMWQGRKVGKDWYIYRNFEQEGVRFTSRQAWIPQADGTVVRTIERSLDGGNTWFTRYREVLKRR